jgi:hypothetical protein
MAFQESINLAKKYFPKLEIKFKNESLIMFIISKILFFNKNFMTEFITTLGHTIYFPQKSFITNHPVSSLIVLLHELVHIYDLNKYGMLFNIGYLSPQIFALLAPLALLFSWKLALVLLLCLLPLPSPFRMYFEKRAYIVSLYSMKKLNDKYNYKINLEDQKQFFVKHFSDSTYYFMWKFSILKDFDQALAKINAGEKPFEDPIFEILDQIISES